MSTAERPVPWTENGLSAGGEKPDQRFTNVPKGPLLGMSVLLLNATTSHSDLWLLIVGHAQPPIPHEISEKRGTRTLAGLQSS